MNTDYGVVQGVAFFSNASVCLSRFNAKPWTEKALSFIQSYGTLFTYAVHKIQMVVKKIESHMSGYTKVLVNGFSKQKLVVCLHGLNNNPSQFKTIIDAIEPHKTPDMDIYIPYILEKGNGKLDDMVRPIFKEICKWAESGGDKELILVGISNGGRIAKAIDAKLEMLYSLKKIRFVSIVGACKGSTLVDLSHKLHLAWLINKNIREEMPTNSRRFVKLNEEWEDNIKHSNPGKRDYTFIASPHDWQVPNYDSTLMDIPDKSIKAHYAIIPGHGHLSIVNAAAKAAAEIVLDRRR